MKLIYVASPYTHQNSGVRELRHTAVLSYTASLIQMKQAAFSPIVYAHRMAEKYALPTDYKFWQEFNDKMMEICDEVHVLRLDGYQESQGVAYEIELAKELGLEIIYV